jgi:molecular chaperone DnaK (HSP70)
VRIGIDFGTTRTLVACVDRGNFPVVHFIDADGEMHDHVPSLVAEEDGRLVFGLDAVAAEARGAPSLRSFKRMLASSDVTGEQQVTIGRVTTSLLELMVGFFASVRESLASSNAPRIVGDDVYEVAVAVPAHAHGAQRYLTLEAFARAGFVVRTMLHEPSAAGFEYTHRQAKTVTSKRTRVVVYDLGGGTFDASLVRVEAAHHEVLGTTGDNRLGGDDFDEALLRCVLAAARLTERSLSMRSRRALRERCRLAKERLTAQAKRLIVDLDELDLPPGTPASVEISVDVFAAEVAPLVEKTIVAMSGLMAAIDGDDALAEVAGIYLVGGATGLPLVPRLLKERFGRRVHRSPYPAASVAIGLAIAVGDELGFSLVDRFSRCFGVFRERDAGRGLRFDPIFTPSTTLPRRGDVVEVTRRYRAAHNIGHYRYVECSALDDADEPTGDLVPFGRVVVAFDPALRGRDDVATLPVMRTAPGPEIEERYVIDEHGVVTVSIGECGAGIVTETVLGR